MISFVAFFLSPSSTLLADRQEPQVQVETKIVETNKSSLRELGTEWHHHERDTFPDRGAGNLGVDQTRSLEHVGQPGNPAPSGNGFDFKPLELAVTPRIQDDGKIDLAVKPQTPTTLIADGNSAVIGGLVQDNPQTSSGKVPLLGKIPILGPLFRNRGTQSEKKELMVFVTPKIIQSSEE
ncbi:MAG: hypothetical protein HY584_06120 [Candidatus Omnitrophica bacterium]|nr:hypothetical protein [Candidatus Omnitrophota bacterium]